MTEKNPVIHGPRLLGLPQILGHSWAEIAAYARRSDEGVILHVEEEQRSRCGEIRPTPRVKRIAILLKINPVSERFNNSSDLSHQYHKGEYTA
jgi:hypothetical protein